jgi:hypothetical protein
MHDFLRSNGPTEHVLCNNDVFIDVAANVGAGMVRAA